MTDFVVVIPARYASTRLPGKMLLDIAGKPMIERVYQQAVSSGASRVIIATDDQRIYDCGQSFGAEIFLTSVEHTNGTSRIAEIIKQQKIADETIIVNVQGDEPLISPMLIKQVAGNLATIANANIATLCEAITDRDEFANANNVKVVSDKNGFALYFSRAAIPWRQKGNGACFRHIGIYAYRAGYVCNYLAYPSCDLDAMESLEQLRALWQGDKIHVDIACQKTYPGVDTEQDLQKARQHFA